MQRASLGSSTENDAKELKLVCLYYHIPVLFVHSNIINVGHRVLYLPISLCVFLSLPSIPLFPVIPPFSFAHFFFLLFPLPSVPPFPVSSPSCFSFSFPSPPSTNPCVPKSPYLHRPPKSRTPHPRSFHVRKPDLFPPLVLPEIPHHKPPRLQTVLIVLPQTIVSLLVRDRTRVPVGPIFGLAGRVGQWEGPRMVVVGLWGLELGNWLCEMRVRSQVTRGHSFLGFGRGSGSGVRLRLSELLRPSGLVVCRKGGKWIYWSAWRP
jgi:hypothetical protein